MPLPADVETGEQPVEEQRDQVFQQHEADRPLARVRHAAAGG